MGLAPIMSIYQARFVRYLKSRGLLSGEEPRIFCFAGDGEMDEPESSGALTLASSVVVAFQVFRNVRRPEREIETEGIAVTSA